jgi:hypothetical protein
MNRTIKETAAKCFHYQSHDQLKTHLQTFLMAYNFTKRLKALKGLTTGGIQPVRVIGPSGKYRLIPPPPSGLNP